MAAQYISLPSTSEAPNLPRSDLVSFADLGGTAHNMVVIAAILAYAAAWCLLLLSIKNKQSSNRIFTLVVPAGISLHAWAASVSVLTENGVQLGFFQIASVLFVAMLGSNL